MLRRIWNMTRYGSPKGPAIEIRWDRREIVLHRMSKRLSARITHWVIEGEGPPGPENANTVAEAEER